ncbi:hypothetical protein UFRH6_50 [Pseudomonas phage UF_RH6]|nr:hypothetical protein UFRH6_50 [Pseudomonas phage UF_RH6]
MTLTAYTTAAKTDGSAVRRIILGMQEAGWRAHSYSDGEERHVLETVAKGSIASLLMETEEAWLYWRKDVNGQELRGTMYFIFQGSPAEVLVDSSMDNGVWDADLARVEKVINLEGL